MTVLRVLLVVQAIGGCAAVVGLSVLLLIEVVFGAFMIAFFVFVAWVSLWVAVGATLFGQWRIGGGDRRWWWAMTGLELLVVLAGIALLLFAYLLEPMKYGAPAPPTLNVVLALVLPVLAVINLVLLVAIRAGDSRRMTP
jgi:hypothetical protein